MDWHATDRRQYDQLVDRLKHDPDAEPPVRRNSHEALVAVGDDLKAEHDQEIEAKRKESQALWGAS